MLKVGDLVVATVTHVEEYGAIVKVEGYPEYEALIPRAHVTAARIRNIRDYVREGQRVVARVIKVDNKRLMVDLSLKYVTRRERDETLKQWKRDRRARKIIEMAVKNLNLPDNNVNRIWGRLQKIYGDVLSALEDTVRRGKDVLLKSGIEGKIAEEIWKLSKKHVKPKIYEGTRTIILRSTRPDGVKLIKDAIAKALKEATNQGAKVTVSYLGAPRYMIKATSTNPKAVTRSLETFERIAKEYIAE